jgi:hypothetical protein
MNFLKAEQLSNAKWRVLSIPFGGPFEGKDLDGEFFSARTDIKEAWFDRRPLVWHHNLDGTMKADPVVGTSDDTEKADEGWWSTIWLDRSHRYWAEIDSMLRAGKIFGSSGSLPNFVRTDVKTGEILVWPFIEQTLTPTPANPYSRVVAAKAIDHFDEARIGLSPAVRWRCGGDPRACEEPRLGANGAKTRHVQRPDGATQEHLALATLANEGLRKEPLPCQRNSTARSKPSPRA